MSKAGTDIRQLDGHHTTATVRVDLPESGHP